MPIQSLITEHFNDTVRDHGFVVVDFWAPWCGPCRAFAPVFEQAAEAHPDVLFVKINTDEEQALAGHFGIRSIPTLMVIREGVIVYQQPGALPRSGLQQVLERARNLDMDEVRRGATPMPPGGLGEGASGGGSGDGAA